MNYLAQKTRAQIAYSNITPPWLLFFWRLVKGDAQGDYAKAWRLLPAHLPATVKCPSMVECAAVLVDHDLAER